MITEKLYTTEDAAQILGVCLRTVQNYIRGGQLKASRIGKTYRIKESDLQAFIDKGTDPGFYAKLFAHTGKYKTQEN